MMREAKAGSVRRHLGLALIESGAETASNGNPYGYRMIGWGMRVMGVCNCLCPRPDADTWTVDPWVCPKCGSRWAVTNSPNLYSARRVS